MVVINDCPANITKTEAIVDLKQADSGLMHCYCYNRIMVESDYSALNDDFKDVYPKHKQKFCNEWLVNYISQYVLNYGSCLIVIIMNMIACMVYYYMGPFSRYKTLNNQNKSIFFKIHIFGFLNFAIVPLFI